MGVELRMRHWKESATTESTRVTPWKSTGLHLDIGKLRMQFLLGRSVSLESLIPDPQPKSREEGKKEAKRGCLFLSNNLSAPSFVLGRKNSRIAAENKGNQHVRQSPFKAERLVVT